MSFSWNRDEAGGCGGGDGGIYLSTPPPQIPLVLMYL